MLDLSALPFWVIPGILVFVFGFGVAVQNFRTEHVSPKELEKIIGGCREMQTREISRLESDMLEIKSERPEIWEKVRETEQRTAVIASDLQWVKMALSEIKISIRGVAK